MNRYFFAVDREWRWFLFREADALGEFKTWEDANAEKQRLIGGAQTEDAAPTWNPKSGGY